MANSTQAAKNNIVCEWLRSLHLGQYAESFLDNGYDDLEICKQVGEPDLDAIGVLNAAHRRRLLHSVRTLREEGAASVYFALEEAAAHAQAAQETESDDDEPVEQCASDIASSARSSKASSGGGRSDKEGACGVATVGVAAGPSAPEDPLSTTAPSLATGKYADEYEEGKAELVKIPRVQLKVLLKDRLQQDGVRLSCQPYSTQEGDRGYLEGLASRYADLFSTHYVDVLGHLEDLRRTEWDSARAQGKLPSETTPLGSGSCGGITGQQHQQAGMTNSQSQPIYVPGKYSPSSCLSDKEEDEIYGFGYGVFAAQIARQQQQRLLGQQQQSQPIQQQQLPPTSHQPLLFQQHHNYQTCLSPRSAYFYEFPPNEQNYTNTNKKRTTFSRFLRGLKTAHRKEKHGSSSPRHGRAATSRGVPQRVDTPDSVLQSGLNMSDLGQNAVLRSMVDPMDYDRLRHLQMNGGTPNTFEETIYRLKVQEALRKREKFTKDHEEILRDIKQGLLNLGKEGIRGPLTGDDTYMYDEDARMLAPAIPCAPPMDRPAHWYDEPPYESDPEDFLMGGQGQAVPQATFRNGRVCFTLNLKQEPRSEGVISLRSAGDISLPKDSNGGVSTPRRGLILPPQAGYPPTIIPLRSSRDRESGDYASDVQSVSSRLSNLSVDTSRSEQLEMGQLISPKYYDHHHHHHHHHNHHHESRLRQYRRVAASAGYARSEDEGMSPSQSSDYEDQEDFGGGESSEQVATVHVSSDDRTVGISGLVGKVRGLREDVQRKISRIKSDNSDQRRMIQDQGFPCSASSVESLPSGSGSSTQALVRAGSNHSSISTEDAEPSPTEQIVGRARALVDQVPSPYDKDALKFKAGDIIEIISMNPSGLWRGICHGRRGTFKFINVELMSERSVKSKRENQWHRNIKGRPATVEELLKRIGLQEYTSVFVLNGYEDLELFKEIEPSDLDYLGIVNVDHRAKILSAVQLLHDLDSGSEADAAGGSSSDGGGGGGAVHTVVGHFDHRHHLMPTHYASAPPPDTSPFDRRCYTASGGGQLTSPGQGAESDTSDGIPRMVLHHGMQPQMQLGDNKNSLDSVVERCSNEILARVRQAQKNSVNLKEELSYQPNIPNSASTEFQQHLSTQQRKPKDSYVSVHGQTTLIDPCRRSLSKGRTKEEICETDPKLASVKYVVGGASDDLGALNVLGRSCLSEKSSDSGVSSSSLSSGNVKDLQTRPAAHHQQQSSIAEPPHSPHIALRLIKQSPSPGQGQPT